MANAGRHRLPILLCLGAAAIVSAVNFRPVRSRTDLSPAYSPWTLSEDGAVLQNYYYSGTCMNASCVADANVMTVAELGRASGGGAGFVPAPGIRNSTWWEQPTSYIALGNTGSYLSFGLGCVEPETPFSLAPCYGGNSHGLVSVHVGTPTDAKSWVTTQTLKLPRGLDFYSSYVLPSPSGRFLAVYWTKERQVGNGYIYERENSTDLNSPFDFSQPAHVLPGDITFLYGPTFGLPSVFACPDDSCILWTTSAASQQSTLGWYTRSADPANRTWSLTATLQIPLQDLPPEKAPYIFILIDLSYGAAGSDDAMIASIVQSSNDLFFTSLVVWSSGVPGQADAGANTWTKWDATIVPEPYPEFYGRSLGWVGTAAGTLHTCVVQWTNASSDALRGYDEFIYIYQIAANESSSAYGRPQVAQTALALPILDPSTGQPFVEQITTLRSSATSGSRFIIARTAENVTQAGQATNILLFGGRMDLWEDLDVYPAATSQYPAWIVPTALGVSVLAAALVVAAGASMHQWRQAASKHSMPATVHTPLLSRA